jgi:23S rRNA pseudouridine955/2504/2580 synthase
MQLRYEGEGERIDTRLSKQFAYSRNFFHHIITRGGITINGQPTKKSYQLKNGDQIFIDDLERYLSPVLLEEAPQINIPIIREEADYLILNKPKGVLSHPNSVRDVKQPSVV